MVTGSVADQLLCGASHDVATSTSWSSCRQGDADRVFALFEDDFYVERDAVRAAIDERSVFNLIHQAYVIKVDCIVRKDSEYRRVEFARRRHGTVEAQDLAFVAPEDLIISKLDWMRLTRSEVQLADVRNLLRSVPASTGNICRTGPSASGSARCIAKRSMSDTPPEVMRRYHAMLLARSPADRLKMGCSMTATARALARASVLAQTRTRPRRRCAAPCSCASTGTSSTRRRGRGSWPGLTRASRRDAFP